MVFFLNSIPIHLLFNSTVFQCDNRSSSYHLTIATEAFIRGGQYFGPGASLTMPSEDWDANIGGPDSNYPQVSENDCLDAQSVISINISSAAAHAAAWNNISATECRDAYSVRCSGIQTTRDLVVIVDQPGGWKTHIVFDESRDSENHTIKSWDTIVPSDLANNLWFSTQCSMAAQTSGGMLECYNACNAALNYSRGYAGESYNITFLERLSNVSDYLRSDLEPFLVRYCLQEAWETECQLGFSVILFFAVTFCIFVKLLQCIVVTRYFSSADSLVTLGDAIAAFIAQPDPYTAGYCTMQRRDAAHWEIGKTHERWHRRSRRAGSAVSSIYWLVTYAALFTSVSIAIYFLFVMVWKHSGL
jgi:hypothetical protein